MGITTKEKSNMEEPMVKVTSKLKLVNIGVSLKITFVTGRVNKKQNN